jgi:HD superfamily phosphodiesterase
VLKILEQEQRSLSETEIGLLQLAAILHDIGRLEITDDHAKLGAQIADEWLMGHCDSELTEDEKDKVVRMIAGHSTKEYPESDFCTAVLKDADTLDEIGAMSVFMASNWIDHQSPFFFHHLRQRLIEYEIPFCDEKLSVMNTTGAKKILREKKAFIEGFIHQITCEIETGNYPEQLLLRSWKNGS